jgi:hypothetical protein
MTRTVLGLARAEASLLVRSVLALAGLLAAGLVTWFGIHPVEPLWWHAAWQIGFGQLVLGLAVLVAAQLAAGRARRDGMAGLYASFPATAGTRTLGQLAGIAGAIPASLLLIGAAAVSVHLLGVVGTPSATVLAGGLLLVLGALALLLSSGTTHLVSGGGIWLVPWEGLQDDLGFLPGPLAGYPPAGAHGAELAGLAVLAVALICLAGAVQLRPVPNLNRLVTDSANPGSAQRCTTSSGVRYCLYPGFGSVLPSLEAAVHGVLARVPARLDRPLTVSQVGLTSLDATLTHGYPKRQVSRWNAELRRAPAIASPESAIYFPIWAWPAFGGPLADAHFNLALATADWAVRIPLVTIASSQSGQPRQPCVPVNQAREAIALWLAILAARPPAGELQAGVPAGNGFTAAVVDHKVIPTWSYPGQGAGQVDQIGFSPPQNTEAGYLLARAMTTLPEPKVARVLAADWATWLNWHTTDAQLAAALGIKMPGVPRPPLLGTGPIGNGPENPVCT